MRFFWWCDEQVNIGTLTNTVQRYTYVYTLSVNRTVYLYALFVSETGETRVIVWPHNNTKTSAHVAIERAVPLHLLLFCRLQRRQRCLHSRPYCCPLIQNGCCQQTLAAQRSHIILKIVIGSDILYPVI